MNELSPLHDDGELADPLTKTRAFAPTAAPARSSRGRRTLALALVMLLVSALGYGFWRHFRVYADVISTAEERRSAVPAVRTAVLHASPSVRSASWPATTEAFEQANIYARASGYISKRTVDIGSRVKAGELLVEITAPEIEHQIAQAEGTLAQLRAALLQAEASRDLAQVTWDRDAKLVQQGWFTQQQGDTDRLTLEARVAAVAVANSNIVAQQAQLQVLRQQKIYQSVIAPFDGVITQRNVDVGALVQADATSGTFLFALAHSDVIRIQLYVPQDEALGVSAGTAAVVRVPEMPSRDFPGKVARIADALQPGTRTLLTEIDVPNPDHALSPGMYCQVELKIPRTSPSVIVPSEAVIFNRNGLSVAVVEDGVVHLRNVTSVRDFGTSIEVSAGVKEGDRVILNPQVDIAEGSKIALRSEDSKN
jgi:RND family efflux transporter MFP subunit